MNGVGKWSSLECLLLSDVLRVASRTLPGTAARKEPKREKGAQSIRWESFSGPSYSCILRTIELALPRRTSVVQEECVKTTLAKHLMRLTLPRLSSLSTEIVTVMGNIYVVQKVHYS